MGDVAREAGVAVQTIYNAVGSKRELLSRALDFAAAGDEAPTPVPVFMHERAQRKTDAREILRQLVDFWRGGLARTAPVFAVIRQAAALDPEVAELQRRRAEQRLKNYGQAAGRLAELDALRGGLSLDDAPPRSSPWAIPISTASWSWSRAGSRSAGQPGRRRR